MICRAGSQQRRDAKFFSRNLNHSLSNLLGTNPERYRCGAWSKISITGVKNWNDRLRSKRITFDA